MIHDNLHLVTVSYECTPYDGKTQYLQGTHLVVAQTEDIAISKATSFYNNKTVMHEISYVVTGVDIHEKIL